MAMLNARSRHPWASAFPMLAPNTAQACDEGRPEIRNTPEANIVFQIAASPIAKVAMI